MEIWLKKEFLSQEFTPYELAVIIYVNMFPKDLKWISIVPTDVYALLIDPINRNNTAIKNIKNGMFSLLEKGLLNSYKTQKGYFEQPTTLRFNKDVDSYFVRVYLDEILTILHSNFNGKFSLLKTFCSIMATLNATYSVENSSGEYKKGVISTMPISHFANLTGNSTLTIIDHIKHLESLKLLYVYRNKQGSRLNNIYSRYQDSNFVDAYVAKKMPNASSSIKNMFNQLFQEVNSNFSNQEDLEINPIDVLQNIIANCVKNEIGKQ